MSEAAAAPSFVTTSRLVARALGTTPAALAAGLRPAVEADLAQVVAFRAAHVGAAAADDERYLRWRYRLGRPVPALGELWLLQVDERLLALIGTEDVVLRAGDISLAAERPMDLQVAAGLHESGLGVWMNQAAAERAAALLAIGGNHRSQGIVRRLFVPLEPLRTYTYVIDSRPFLRKAGWRGGAGALLATLGNAALRLREGWLAWREGGSARHELRAVRRFEPGDALADARADSAALTFERSAAALNHRLFANPRACYEVVAAHDGVRRVGAVAWRVEPGLAGLPQIHVIDLWTCDGDADEGSGPSPPTRPNRPALPSSPAWPALQALMAHVFAQARHARCHAVRLATADPRLGRRLLRLGFASPGKGGEGTPMGLIVRGDIALARQLAERSCAITALLDDDDGTYSRGHGYAA